MTTSTPCSKWYPLLAACLLLCGGTQAVMAADDFERVQITDPFIELHTGAGDGYPILQVGKRGETIEILLRQADWFKVRTAGGAEGWVQRTQLEQTLTSSGAVTRFRDLDVADYTQRRWETGASVGQFSSATAFTLFGARSLTSKLFAELSATHVLGDYSSDTLLGVGLIARPFPAWHWSPYFRLGAGAIHVAPKATLAQTPDRTDSYAQVGGGMQMYLTQRYALRVEYDHYAIFSGRDETEEPEEWKVGVSVFF